MNLKDKLDKEDIIEIGLEYFIKDPQQVLKDLCMFLDVDTPLDYLENCETITFKRPKRTRDKIGWDKKDIYIVEQKMKLFPFLEGYSFEN